MLLAIVFLTGLGIIIAFNNRTLNVQPVPVRIKDREQKSRRQEW